MIAVRRNRRTENVLARFWARVQCSPNGCWIWTGQTDARSYGRFSLPRRGSGAALAHRFMWGLVYGYVPRDRNVLHHCDNPPCVRPDHLFLGTQADNVADMLRKGRCPTGMRRRHTKLTDQQVIEIRASREPQRAAAQRYGISGGHVCDIRNGKKRVAV